MSHSNVQNSNKREKWSFLLIGAGFYFLRCLTGQCLLAISSLCWDFLLLLLHRLVHLTAWLLLSERSNQSPHLLLQKAGPSETVLASYSFEGLPGRLQEVIRGKYVLSSSSSFRPPLDQPASVWENWFSPSPPTLLSCFSSFFPFFFFASQVPFEACSSTREQFCETEREKRIVGHDRLFTHIVTHPRQHPSGL